MYRDNLTLLMEDPTLPDLVPEDPIFDELFRVDDWTIPTIHPDVAELARKLDSLTIESNTQGLRLEIEKAKRQRLQASVRQLRRDLATPCPELVKIRTELSQFKESQNAINYQLDGENARTNALTFRSLSRICEILATLIPTASLPPEFSPEVKILLQELTTTIHHFGVHYTTPYG